MALLIKGLRLPQKGARNYISIEHDGTVYWHFFGIEHKEEKVFATEVPEPHGRLIDASEAYDKIAEQEGGNYVDMDAVGMGLDETPTVIPASEEE